MVTVIDWKEKLALYFFGFLIIGSIIKTAPEATIALFVIFIAAYMYRQKTIKEVAERERKVNEEKSQKKLELFNSLKANIVTTSSTECKEQHTVNGFVSGKSNTEEAALFNLLLNAEKLGANMIIGLSVSRNDDFYMSGTAIRVEK